MAEQRRAAMDDDERDDDGADDGTVNRLPVGILMGWAVGVPVPDGWFPCDGRHVSRLAYAELFTVVGTRFGAGDGETTFAVPNLRPDAFLQHIILAEDPRWARSKRLRMN